MSEVRKILMIDPSDRGGIAAATEAVAIAVLAAGAAPELLASRGLPEKDEPYPVWRSLPVAEWGRPVDAGPAFFARRLLGWLRSASVVGSASRHRQPDVIDFQAPLNRRFDTRLIRRLRRRAPVAWTVHDPLPLDGSPRDKERFATIYATADLVFVHSAVAATRVHDLAGVEPVILPLPPLAINERVGRAEARRRLGLPEQERVFGALGFIRRYKGYDLLAEVWEHLGNDAPLLLITGELVDESQAPILERLRATGRVMLKVGYASDAELQIAFEACDGVLLPHSQASPSGLLAMARSFCVPVIASDAPELASAVLKSEGGRVVPRTLERWCEAVTDELPAAPAPVATATDLGSRRLSAYEDARAAWEGSRRRLRQRPATGAARPDKPTGE